MPVSYRNYWFQRLFKNSATKVPYSGDAEKVLWNIRLFGAEFQVIDYANSKVPQLVFKELTKRELDFSQFELPDSATIVDIGGQVGIVSIFMAMLYPNSRIYAFEAFDKNYENLLANIELNGIANITAENIAITGDGREFRMVCHEHGNTGGSTGWTHLVEEEKSNYSVKSTTLDAILERIGGCDLLKIDCEGAEFEILHNCTRLDTIKNFVGEFHTNSLLASKGYDMDKLERAVRDAVKGEVQLRKMTMCE